MPFQKHPMNGCFWMATSQSLGSEAKISVFDHGLLYGDGVFEGNRFYNGRPFRHAVEPLW